MLKLLKIFILLAFFWGCKGPTRTIIDCGGGAQFACPDGWFCDYGSACGGMDQRGQCRPHPLDCSLDEELVCGCDGTTYTNPCFSHAKGVSVAYEGSCMKKVEPPKKTQRKMEMPDLGKPVDGSRVEEAGDDVSEQYRSF